FFRTFITASLTKGARALVSRWPASAIAQTHATSATPHRPRPPVRAAVHSARAQPRGLVAADCESRAADPSQTHWAGPDPGSPHRIVAAPRGRVLRSGWWPKRNRTPRLPCSATHGAFRGRLQHARHAWWRAILP